MVALSHVSVGSSALTRRSVRREPWQIAFVREIGPEDHALMQAAAVTPSDPRAPLARLREPHHYLAKLLAKGENEFNASRITGYSIDRVRTLNRDPAFSELVAHYTQEQAAAEADIDLAIKHSALVSGAILAERMEEQPETFSNKELLAIHTASLDRIGKGPTSKRTVEITNVAAVLGEVREMMAVESASRVIDRNAPIEITLEYDEVVNVESTQTQESEKC